MKEHFKDQIKPPSPPEFEEGTCITPEELAAYIDKPNLEPEHFRLSGRSKRVGHYELDRQRWIVGKYSYETSEDGNTALKFVLSNYSHQGECTENGIIDCRQYVFVVEGDHLKCESYHNEMLGFYDQMALRGNSIEITI